MTDHASVRGDATLHRLTQPEFPLRRNLQRALARVLAEYLQPGGRAIIADIGAGDKPWAEMLEPYARRHLGVDENRTARTDVVARAELLPLRNIDVVLCTQMLEHAVDPRQCLAEYYSVLRPGGTVILSTHGTYVYHPDPLDFWRYTHEGLHKLFQDAGFQVETILACEGPITVAGFYLGHALHTQLYRMRRVHMASKLVVVLNNLLSQLLEPAPRSVYTRDAGLMKLGGDATLNYVVVARKAGPTPP